MNSSDLSTHARDSDRARGALSGSAIAEGFIWVQSDPIDSAFGDLF